MLSAQPAKADPMRQTQGTKITFLNPPFLEKFSRAQRSPAVTKSGTLYFPMWLAYAAGFSEQGGHEIDLIDAPAAGLDADDVLERISSFAPAILVVETSTPSIFNDVDYCTKVKASLPDVLIVLVGTHVSALPRQCLQLSDAVDIVAIGEYDETILELSDALSRGTALDQVAGICLRGGGTPVFTARRKPITDLERLPMVSQVYRRFLDIRHYFNPNAIFPMVTITTSRGCPNQCTFCVYPQTLTGHNLRKRSTNSVVDEIEYIQSAFPEVKSIFFEDDTFPANKERCGEICNEMLCRHIRIPWSANVRVDVDPETFRLMKRAGCRTVCVGFESGDQKMLDNIKKHITVEQSYRFMDVAREIGMIVHGCFIVGLPGETKETMDRTLRTAIELAPDTAQFYPIMVYPGTEAYNWYDKNNLLSTHDFSKWLTPSGLHNTVIRTEAISAEELVEFCDDARRRFYLRPRYLLYRLGRAARDTEELKRTFKAGKTFLKYLIKGSDVTDGR